MTAPYDPVDAYFARQRLQEAVERAALPSHTDPDAGFVSVRSADIALMLMAYDDQAYRARQAIDERDRLRAEKADAAAWWQGDNPSPE